MRRLLGLVLVTGLVLLTTGCLRAQVAAAVRTDDTVTGEIVIATVVPDDNTPGAVITPPTELADRVTAQPYRQDDYAGTRLLFNQLNFEEFGRLHQVPGAEGNRLRFQLRRSGGLVLFTGRADLVELPAPERADVEIRMSFPGRITATNGQQRGNEVSWRPGAGQVTELTATVRYADPNEEPWTYWVMVVGLLAGGVVIVVLALAYLARRRWLRSMAGVR
jgi:hypothetical protein